MYEKYWDLKLKPFQNTPDPRFLYYTAQHKDAFGKLEYAIKEKMGCALLVGLWGCGKTSLLHALMDTLNPEKYRFILIDYPPRDRIELLTGLLAGLGDKKVPTQRAELLSNILMSQIKNYLTEHHKEGKETVIILDEAHLIKDSILFEELRLLLNLQLKDQFLLTLILSGQSELEESINDIKQLEQRIALKSYLGNLSSENTSQYILYRLKVAGGNRPLFTESALNLIYQYSGGIPRRINRLCDLSLLAGSQRGVEQVDESLIQEQARGLAFGTEAISVSIPVAEPPLVTPTETKPTLPTTAPQPVPSLPAPGIDDEGAKQLYETLLLVTENIFNQVRLKEDINIQPAYKIIEKMVVKLQNGDNTLLALAYQTATDNYLIGHSVNVCVLALKLGLAQKMDNEHLMVLGLGGLLHDIGIVKPVVTIDELLGRLKPEPARKL